MKKLITILFFFLCFSNIFGQNTKLLLEGSIEKETKILDSLVKFDKKKIDLKLISKYKDSISEQLFNNGFFNQKIIEEKKVNDSTYFLKYQLGKKTNYIHIYIGDKKSLINITKDTLFLNVNKTELFLRETSKIIENKGYAVSKVYLDNFVQKNDKLFCELTIDADIKRTINTIEIEGNYKLPKGLSESLKRKYKNKLFNSSSVELINRDLNNIKYVKQVKYPEVLFSKDSTKVYVFLEKSKSNSFDGYIGFSNSNSDKIALNGYIDLNLNNSLNSGENISLKWRSDANSQRTLNLSTEIPYLFKSPIGIKFQLNIFKQDTTFQNSKFSIDALYNFNFKSKLFIGYSSTESSDINNINTLLLNDFKSEFITTTFEYNQDFEDLLFTEKTFASFSLGSGNRKSILFKNNQTTITSKINHLFKLNEKNYIFLSNHNFILLSDQYLTNELFRFGGIKSIRGFNENSLQASSAYLLFSEYRYKPTNNFYIHSILDYGRINDSSIQSSNKLFGFGGGIGLLTKNGLFNFVFANSIDNKNNTKFSNSIIHISFKSLF